LSQQATATARALPSFPTRRSSDLLGGVVGWAVDEPDPPHPEPELAAAPRAVGVEGAPVGVLQLLGPAVGVPCQPVVLDEAADCVPAVLDLVPPGHHRHPLEKRRTTRV